MAAPQSPLRPTGRPQPPRARDAQSDVQVQHPLDALQSMAFADGDANVASVGLIDEGVHRASPLGIVAQLITLVLALGVATLGLVITIVQGDSGSEDFAAGVVGLASLGGALLFAVLAVVLGWYTRTWELADDAFVLRSGLLVRNARRIPYQRVHSVDLSSSVVERVLGLTTLTVDTGAGDATAGNAVKYMKRIQAEALKRALFARKMLVTKEEAVHTGVASGHAAEPRVPVSSRVEPQEAAADISYEMTLSHKLHLLASLTDLNMGAAFLSIAGALAAMLQFAEPLIGSLVYEAVAQAFSGALDGIVRQVSAANVMAMMPAALVLVLALGVLTLVATWVISAVVAFVRWGGFVLRCRGTRVEVSSGLLSRTTRAVDLSRVQSVAVNQSLPRRCLGYAQVVVQVVAVGDKSQRASVVLHPCLPLAEVPAFLGRVLPEFAPVVAQDATGDADLVSLPGAALRRTLLRGVYWTLGLVVLAMGATWYAMSATDVDVITHTVVSGATAVLWALVVAGCAIMFVVRVLAWRIRRIGTRRSVLVLVDGGVTRRVSYTARTKLQSLSRRVTPFQARARVATVSARTACVSPEHDPRMRDVEAVYANELLAWVRPSYDNAQEAEEALRAAGIRANM